MLEIRIDENSRAGFVNNAAFCVGTGRLGLALHREYQEQLAAVQALCGFQHIRGHGLFHDDVGILQSWPDSEGRTVDRYCFTYLDRIIDGWMEQGLRPFLELGFMPGALASSEQTLFYWKAHTVPPRDEERWVKLVQATLRHLVSRYGREEVQSWPVEVWNEPNLPGFWEHADKAKYLRLYEVTAPAVKEVLPEMKVGGPAICGGDGSLDWVRDFLTFCRDRKLPVDFVTRHAYMGKTPEHKGRYLYHEMCAAEEMADEMRRTREVIDSFEEYRGMPMHITEFNTSYNPFCPIHDTNRNAAIIASVLSRLGEVAASYSYWTFGDVFEEQGIPPRVFHGGFGLMANGCIPKPTLWTFAFFNGLKGECVHRDDFSVVMRREDGSHEAVLWNDGAEALDVSLTLPAAGGTVCVTETVDDETCNPLKAWHDLGKPSSLTREQLNLLRACAQPRIATLPLMAESGAVSISMKLKPGAVVRLQVMPVQRETDEGYDYGYYL